MRVLVTGANGKVGSRVVPRLLARGDAVRVLVRRQEQGDAWRPQGAEGVLGDLLDPATLGPAVAGVDAVVHLAAFFRGATPEQARAVNLAGTRRLATAALAAGIPRFLFASTNLVYGPGRDRPAREDDPLQPPPGYPASKAEAEEALRELGRTAGLGLRVLRLAFVYGERDPHLAEALPLFRAWPPTKRLQMVHYADVAQAIILVLDAPDIDGRTYNVADDEPVPAAAIFQLQGEAIAEGGTDRPLTNPWEGIVDTARIRADLGFRPFYPSLREAVAAHAL